MTTRLTVKNNTAEDVLAYITLGATPGCVQDVASITGTKITKLYPLMGNFTIPANTTYELKAPAGLGFNGNFSFGTPPLNCPAPGFEHGVNLAEFIINNGFQPGGQETVDISCVCGANAYVEFTMDTGDWSSNGGNITMVKHIKNSTCYDNTGRVGVFPYGCDNCTSSDNPPECVGQHSEYANKSPICNVQRPANNNAGGTVGVVFNGYIAN